MADQDLTPLLVDALGKRIDEPAATRFTAAIGKRPFKSATPNNPPVIVDRGLGLEVGASMRIRNRAYWPYRKEGRTWLTWVSHAFIYPNYRGSLPAGFNWQMDEASLSARFERRVDGVLRAVRFTLPPPRDGLRASVELDNDGRPRHLLLGISEERDYATMHPGSRPEHNIEHAFFAAWCGLCGMLSDGRIPAEQLAALQARLLTPLAFFSASLQGLLWQGDVKPQFDAFCYAYMKGLMDPDEAAFLPDVRQVFGGDNVRRAAGEPMTDDNWANYDRIAPVYEQRLEQWHRAEIHSKVAPRLGA